MKLFRHPLFLGGIAFVVANLILSFVIQTTCVDGWRSPSIGTQGACSAHGGVESSTFMLRLMLSAAIGVAVAGLAVWLRRQLAPPPPAVAAAVTELTEAPPHCESCGAPMALRTGDGAERYRWVCTRAGTEHPTRPMDPTPS